MLARLALAPDRAHPREELVELLWPGADLAVGRNRLRQALSTLKSLLEPAGPASAPVLLADRLTIRLRPGTLDCDVGGFEACLRSGDLAAARALYRGELMPGHYEDWVIEERQRLAMLFEKLDSAASAVPAPTPAVPAQTNPWPSGLPHFWTRSLGAEIVASRLRVLVGVQRLVTVHGPGGSGKTRLAVEVARALRDEPPLDLQDVQVRAPFHRVVFVPLVDCVDATQTLDAVSVALHAGHAGPARARILAALGSGKTLMVLDNIEQLDATAVQEIEHLLRGAPRLHLLATSRRIMDVDGEQAFELDGLPLPPAEGALADIATNPAVMLFVDRARAVRADFQLDARNAQAIAGLVRLLSGMPLAIELAASRVRGLAPAELLQRLTRDAGSPMLDVLARSAQRSSSGSRHESMRHVVDWSWRQLSPALVGAMQAMATFAVPARIETVAAVAGLDTDAAHQRVEQLRDQSLVVVRIDASGLSRYVLLQPVREFVAERTDPAAAALGRQRLRQWLIAFGQRCAAQAHRAIAEVEAELPQLYSAIVSAAAEGASVPSAQVQAAQMAVALRRHWDVDTRAGLPLSVVQSLETVQAHLQDAALRCETCVLLSYSLVLAGSVNEALPLAETAVALAPDARCRAHALLRLVQVWLFSDRTRPELDATLAEGLALARAAGELEVEAMTLRMLFLVAVNRDADFDRAEPLAQQAQALWESLGHRRNAHIGLMDRASCWIAQRRFEEAANALQACEDVAHQEHYATGHITASWQLGRAFIKLRQADAALAAFRRCVRDSWQHSRLAYVADALVLTPGGLALTGRTEDAARLHGFAVAHWQSQFGPFYRDLERETCRTRRLLLHRLGPMRLEALRLQGAGLTLAEGVALALADSAAP